MPLVAILTVLTVLVAVIWVRYARDVREIPLPEDSPVVYDRHYIMISQEKSGMWESIYESARKDAAENGVYLEWAGWDGTNNYTAADCMRIAIASQVDGIILYSDGSSGLTELIDEAM